MPRGVAFAEYRKVVRRFRPSDLLPKLAQLAVVRGIEGNADISGYGAYPWAIALTARESILSGREHQRADVTSEGLRQIFNAANDIVEVRSTFEVLDLLTRVFYEQFGYQESMFEELSRTHAMLVEGADTLSLEVIGDDTWVEMLGAPIGQVVGATFLLAVAAYSNAGRIDLAWLDHPDLQALYNQWPREIVERRANELTSTFSEFAVEYRARNTMIPAGFERYAYNPLVAKPIVQLPDGKLIAPQPRLLLPTVTPGGLYHRGIQAHGTKFTRDLGKLAEAYVGRQLRSIEPSPSVRPEVTYHRRKGEELKSIDWFLDLPGLLVLFEVKSARAGLAQRAALDGYVDAMTKVLDKAITQLTATAMALDDHLPEFAHLPAGKPRLGVIVTSEPYYTANSHWAREHVAQAPFPTLTASMRDLEHLVQLPADEIGRQLTAVAETPERLTWQLGRSLDFSNARERNPILEAAWNSYPWP